MQPEPDRFGSQGLDVTRHWIIGLVAVHVHHQPTLSGDLAQSAHGRRALSHRTLEMRNAADHIDAEIESAFDQSDGPWEAKIAVLRKCNELQIEIRLHPTLDLEQRFNCEQPRV